MRTARCLLNSLLPVLFISAVSPLYAQQRVEISSPNGNIRFLFHSDKEASYKVIYKHQTIIDSSPFSFELDNGKFGNNLDMGSPVYRTGDESYDLVVGKAKHLHSRYQEVSIPLKEKNAPFREIHLILRTFDDGVAFRYEFPEQAGWQSYVMYDERTTFNIQGNPTVLALFLPSYTSSHEGKYSRLKFHEIESGKLIDMPALFEFPHGTFLAITEAGVVNYAGMYLSKEDGLLRGKLSPYTGQPQIKVKATLPHKSPWRVMMISDRIGALIESNILTHLTAPCKIEDTSWIKPGKTTFTWWNGNITPDTTFSPGNNFETNKYYIDFAARNKIDFHSIYGYAEQPWYTDDGFNFSMPGNNVDITKPIAPLNMKAICDYAESKGVGIHVWVNWKALYMKIDKALALFEQWGIKGMMVDFMDRDDQEMILIQEEILEKAAKHHLFVQFHGSSKPSGLHRTYPNEFTREGTLNYECYKWGYEMSADHDISIPFTRLLAGATDYHLGGFRAVPLSEFKVQYTHPLVTGTRCHMLAMYVILESYLSMVCDTPPSYEGQPGFEFIRELPVTWDETRVLDAVVNEYIAIARRKNDEWHIGAITNGNARTLDIPLDFLDNGTYIADIYTDAKDVDVNPNHLLKQTRTITSADILTLRMAASGGTVLHIKKR
jgi:alpha-glucosidase